MSARSAPFAYSKGAKHLLLMVVISTISLACLLDIVDVRYIYEWLLEQTAKVFDCQYAYQSA